MNNFLGSLFLGHYNQELSVSASKGIFNLFTKNVKLADIKSLQQEKLFIIIPVKFISSTEEINLNAILEKDIATGICNYFKEKNPDGGYSNAVIRELIYNIYTRAIKKLNFLLDLEMKLKVGGVKESYGLSTGFKNDIIIMDYKLEFPRILMSDFHILITKSNFKRLFKEFIHISTADITKENFNDIILKITDILKERAYIEKYSLDMIFSTLELPQKQLLFNQLLGQGLEPKTIAGYIYYNKKTEYIQHFSKRVKEDIIYYLTEFKEKKISDSLEIINKNISSILYPLIQANKIVLKKNPVITDIYNDYIISNFLSHNYEYDLVQSLQQIINEGFYQELYGKISEKDWIKVCIFNKLVLTDILKSNISSRRFKYMLKELEFWRPRISRIKVLEACNNLYNEILKLRKSMKQLKEMATKLDKYLDLLTDKALMKILLHLHHQDISNLRFFTNEKQYNNMIELIPAKKKCDITKKTYSIEKIMNTLNKFLKLVNENLSSGKMKYSV